MDFRFSETFGHFQQEGYLAKSSLLSGFDSLLKANFAPKDYGHFYSAFFQLSIGTERLMKIAIMTNHMIENDYKPLTDSELKNNYSHKISKLYEHAIKITNKTSPHQYTYPKTDSPDFKLLEFLTNFANQDRYYNLSMVSSKVRKESPLALWHKLAMEILEDEYTFKKMNRDAEKLLYELDQNGMTGYTYEKDFEGHPMTFYDQALRFRLTAKSAPFIVWRIINLLNPIYKALNATSMTAHNIETGNNSKLPIIPYMFEFFPFLLSTRADAIRRKRWLSLF